MAYDDTTLVKGARSLGLSLDGRQRSAFGRYYRLLARENPAAGLTTVVDPEGVQRRHFLESIALVPALSSLGLALTDGKRLIDVGSGGGFPGLPLAIALPGLMVTLLDSHGRRAAFLQRTVEELALTERVRVVRARAEDAAHDPAERETYDLAVSRAAAPLPALVELTLPFVRVGGAMAAIKGSRASAELEQARVAIASLGGGLAEIAPLVSPAPAGELAPRLLVVRKLSASPPRYPRRAGVPARRPLGS